MLENLVDLRPSLPSMAMRGIPPLPQSAPISVLPIDSQLREVLSVHGYDRTVRPHLFDGSFQTGGMVFQRGFSNILRKDEVDKRHQNAGTPTPIVDATSFKVTPYFLQIGKRVLLMREGLYCGGSEGNFAIREQLLKYKFKLEDVVEANQNLSIRGNLLFFNFGEAELTNQLIAQHTIAAMLAIDLNPESIRDKYVVDLGCGTGILSVVADAYSPLHLAMVDNSKRSIEGAKDNVFQNTGLDVRRSVRNGVVDFAAKSIGEWARSRDAQNIQTVVANVGPHDLYGGRSAGGAWMQVMDYVCGNDKIANVMLAGLFERGQYSINDEEMRRLENAGYKETDRVVVRYCPAIEHSGSPVCHVFSRG